MARSEARLQLGLWRAGLDGLSAHAKLMYCVLLTEPTVNHAGVGALRVSRWTRDASLSTVETEKALQELTDSEHIVIDEDTEEILIRTIIRRDGVADQPYVLKGALREALLTTSRQLRKTLAGELRKLPPRRPDGVSKNGGKVVYPDPHATAAVLDPDGPKPTQKALRTLSASDSQKGPETLLEGFSSKGSETLLGGGGGGGISSTAGTSVSRPAQERGTRLPENFTVSEEMVAWARQNCPSVDGRFATDKFMDHFRAKAGRDGTKKDWPATWRNWMRTEQERISNRPAHLRPVQAAFDTDPAVTGLRRVQE